MPLWEGMGSLPSGGRIIPSYFLTHVPPDTGCGSHCMGSAADHNWVTRPTLPTTTPQERSSVQSNSQGSDKGCGKDRRSPHSTRSPTSCQAAFSAQHPVKCLKVALLWDLHLNAIALSKKTTLLTQGTSCERVLPHPRAKGCRHLRHR